jgi:hypothetical protein
LHDSFSGAIHSRNGDGGNAEQKKFLPQVREKAQAGDPAHKRRLWLLLELRRDMNIKEERPLDWFVQSGAGGVPSRSFSWACIACPPWCGAARKRRQGLAWLQMAVDAGRPRHRPRWLTTCFRGKPDTAAFAKAQDLLANA